MRWWSFCEVKYVSCFFHALKLIVIKISLQCGFQTKIVQKEDDQKKIIKFEREEERHSVTHFKNSDFYLDEYW